MASLLESAGFSRSNPYNIVQQGKVVQLTVMSPEKVPAPRRAAPRRAAPAHSPPALARCVRPSPAPL